MDKAWIGVIGALGGVLVAGIAEAFRSQLAFHREKRWTALEDRRRHLESVYEALEVLREAYGHTVAHAAFVASQGKAPEQQGDAKVPWAKLKMLVHLYVPTLAPELSKVEKAGPALALVSIQAISAGTGRGDKGALARLQGAHEVFDRYVNEMRDAIIHLSQERDADVARLTSKTRLWGRKRDRAT